MVWYFIQQPHTDSFVNSFFDIIHLTLGYGILRNPDTLLLKFFIGTYLIYCLHINTIFQGKLSGVLTAPNLEPRLKTIEELADSNIIPAMVNYSFNEFETCKTNVAKKLRQKAEVLQFGSNSSAKFFEYVSRNGSVTYLAYGNHFINLLSSKSSLYTITEDSCKTGFKCSFAFRRGIPVLLTMNQIIRGIREGGLVNKWLSDLMVISFEPNSPKHITLTIEHLKAAFILLGFGCSASFLVFIGEIVIMSR